jgi:hypothetical protein
MPRRRIRSHQLVTDAHFLDGLDGAVEHQHRSAAAETLPRTGSCDPQHPVTLDQVAERQIHELFLVDDMKSGQPRP